MGFLHRSWFASNLQRQIISEFLLQALPIWQGLFYAALYFWLKTSVE
jgi:hypothetical protein